MGNGRKAPCILSLGIDGSGYVGFMHRSPHSRGNTPHCPLHRRMDRPQNRSGSFGEKKSLWL